MEPEARNDLVKNEHRAVFICQPSHPFKKARMGDLPRGLHDDGGELTGIAVEEGLQRSSVVIRKRVGKGTYRLRHPPAHRRGSDVPVLPTVIAAASNPFPARHCPRET